MFRRSGSFVTFFVEGKLPSPDEPSFCEALAKHRFRTIENAAAEQVSIGWVTPGDPSGNSFEVEDMQGGHAWWLRVRIDKKKLPAAWVGIYRTEAERSAGRSLTVKEKRELREGLEQKLLPRVLPSVQFVDSLFFPDRGMLLLFATSQNVQEEFAKLVRLSFDVHLAAADPHRLAEEMRLDPEQRAYLEQIAPVRWHAGGDDAKPRLDREIEDPAELQASVQEET